MKVVIMTCDEYAWIVPVFMRFYKKHWPDNPYPIEIVTETKRRRARHIDGEVFYAGKISWSDRLINYLKQSEEDRFILFLEDYFLITKVDTELVQNAERLCEDNVGEVRLNNCPSRYSRHHRISSDIEGFSEYPLDGRCSMLIQVAIWQKRFLFDVLRGEEDVWQAERAGSERLKKLKSKWKILWPETNIINYPIGGLMEKGMLRPSIVKWTVLDLIG